MNKIKIGKQVWSLENLNVDHYRNGDIIPEVQDPKEWSKLATGAWCYYDNDGENGKKYGKLYNWYAVNDKRGLVPDGWHIPTIEEFATLRDTINRNRSSLITNFSALLAGNRDTGGNFYGLDDLAYYLSSIAYDDTSAIDLCLSLSYDNSCASYFCCGFKESGFSVRIIKDKGKNNE